MNLNEGKNAHADYILTRRIFDDDELLDALKAALQIMCCEVCGCSHSSLLNALQIREVTAFKIEDALTLALYVKEVMGHGGPLFRRFR